MAVIQFKNGKVRTVPADRAIAVWRCVNGDSKGSPEMQKFAANVKRVWLNKETAPESYMMKYFPDEAKPTERWYDDI